MRNLYSMHKDKDQDQDEVEGWGAIGTCGHFSLMLPLFRKRKAYM